MGSAMILKTSERDHGSTTSPSLQCRLKGILHHLLRQGQGIIPRSLGGVPCHNKIVAVVATNFREFQRDIHRGNAQKPVVYGSFVAWPNRLGFGRVPEHARSSGASSAQPHVFIATDLCIHSPTWAQAPVMPAGN